MPRPLLPAPPLGELLSVGVLGAVGGILGGTLLLLTVLLTVVVCLRRRRRRRYQQQQQHLMQQRGAVGEYQSQYCVNTHKHSVILIITH